MKIEGLLTKVFYESSHRKLEEVMNEWLATNSGQAVEMVLQSSNNAGHMVTVFYRRY